MSFGRLTDFLCLEEVDPGAVDARSSKCCECYVQQEGCGRDEGTAGDPQATAHRRDARVPAGGLPAAGRLVQTMLLAMPLGNRHRDAAFCQPLGGYSWAPTVRHCALMYSSDHANRPASYPYGKVQGDEPGNVSSS